MSRALLDFTASPGRPAFWAWPILALGVAAALVAGQAYLAAEQDLSAAQQLLDSLEQEVKPKPRKTARPDPQAQARQRLEAAAQRQLDLPWAALVDTLQRTRPVGVAFLAMNADGRRGDFQVNAQAKDHKIMLDYLHRLQALPGLAGVVLTQHESVQSDGVSAVGFTLHGTWVSVDLPGGGEGEAKP